MRQRCRADITFHVKAAIGILEGSSKRPDAVEDDEGNMHKSGAHERSVFEFLGLTNGST